jgi:hypothetical protein
MSRDSEQVSVEAFQNAYVEAVKIAESALGDNESRWKVQTIDDEGARFVWGWDNDTEFMTWDEILSGKTLTEHIKEAEEKRRVRHRAEKVENDLAILRRLKAAYPEEGK